MGIQMNYRRYGFKRPSFLKKWYLIVIVQQLDEKQEYGTLIALTGQRHRFVIFLSSIFVARERRRRKTGVIEKSVHKETRGAAVAVKIGMDEHLKPTFFN